MANYVRREWNKGHRSMNTYNVLVNIRNDILEEIKGLHNKVPTYIHWKYDGVTIFIYVHIDHHDGNRKLLWARDLRFLDLDRDLDWFADRFDKFCNAKNNMFERKYLKNIDAEEAREFNERKRWEIERGVKKDKDDE